MSIRRVAYRLGVAVTAASVLATAAAPMAFAETGPGLYGTYGPKFTTTQASAEDGNFEALSSKPGAPKTIWLVFDGGTLTGSPWNKNRENAARNDTPVAFGAVDGDSKELRREVYLRMAEYYSPFDVNVTTVRPSDDQLAKTSETDAEYGDVAVFTANSLGEDGGNGLSIVEGALGVAHSKSFGDFSDNFAWTTSVGQEPRNARQLAATAAHEVGHTLSLGHQGWSSVQPAPEGGYVEGPNTNIYYSPNTGFWAPIMGNADNIGMDRWTDGQYPNATNGGQNDLAAMTSSSWARSQRWAVTSTGQEANDGWCGDNPDAYLPNASGACDGTGAHVDVYTYYSGALDFRQDDHGNALDATATALPLGSKVPGVIERNFGPNEVKDKDVFRVDVPTSGKLDVSAAVAEYGPMLDVKLSVYDAAGSLVGQPFDPAPVVNDGNRRSYVSGMSASGRVDVTPGTYYLTVEGVGYGTTAGYTQTDTSSGMPEYGSIGQYTISASMVTPLLSATATGRVVTVSATTEGAPSTPGMEYRIGAGAWQSYAGPVTVPGSDARTLEYRLTGSSTTAGTVTVAATGAAVAAAQALGQTVTLNVGQTASGSGVRLTDASGGPVVGQNVVFAWNGTIAAVAGSGATTATVKTNADGIAVVPPLTTTAAGQLVITASHSAGSTTLPTVSVVQASASIAGWTDATPKTVTGKVALDVRAYNTGADPVTIQLKTKYGLKTYGGITTDKGVSVTFKSYTTSIPTGAVSAVFTSATGTNTFGYTYDAYAAQ